GLSDRRAALGSHARQFDIATERNCHSAFFEDLAIEIYLSQLLVEIAARQATQHRQWSIGLIPGLEPAFAVQMEGIDEGQPAIGLARLQSGFQPPIAGP